MKKVYKRISITLVLLSIASILLVSPLSAMAISTAQTPMDNQETYNVEANNQYQMEIATRTRINISSSTDKSIQGQVNFEPTIADKEFAIDISQASDDVSLNMTCTEEQEELGLLNGKRVTARNRHRFIYREQFVVNISCNCTEIQARLRIRANNENREGTWAYYNTSTQEWVGVESQVQDGFLVADTDHFSTWTVIIPESDGMIDPMMIAGIVVGVVAVIGVLGLVGYLYKKQ